MSSGATSLSFVLDPLDNNRLANLCGPCDEHIHQLERSLGVQILRRGNSFNVQGLETRAQVANRVLETAYRDSLREPITRAKLHMMIQTISPTEEPVATEAPVIIRTRRISVKAQGASQVRYIHNLRSRDVSFGVGPAGTGKTYLAVATAVEALLSEKVKRLVLVRPAVEAGEKLGFLPGDLAQKIDPYLRPIYDALHEMLGPEQVAALLERNVIELAPLAYMRGRTLNEAFVLLDEAQNTTPEQMKMFLTRLGFGSTAVITGDGSQVDLPAGQRSGLGHALSLLDGVEGISITRFTSVDVVRHALVQRIIDAYELGDSACRR
ncbi:MAG: PhoH family protein [Gammaproteobacteria bacterium]|nr:PhoH family protein [Gammaproteobacteria bacterium]